jgi:hypothetical protein
MSTKSLAKQQEQTVPESAVESDAAPAYQQVYGNAAAAERLAANCSKPRSPLEVGKGLNGFGGLVSAGINMATKGNPGLGILGLGKNLFDAADRQSECAPHVTRPQNGQSYDEQHDAATKRALNGTPEPDSTLMKYLECLDANQGDQNRGPKCQKDIYGE